MFPGAPPAIFASRLDSQAGKRTRTKVVDTGELAFGPGFSPDGKWIVYAVGRRGNDPAEVYAQPFPGPGLRTQIAEVVGHGFPVWRKDGKEIAIADGREVRSVPVEVTAQGLRFGTPELLFSGLRWPAGTINSDRPLAVSRDGSRFYFAKAVEQPNSGVIHVTLETAGK
jgi:hypothetical protein